MLKDLKDLYDLYYKVPETETLKDRFYFISNGKAVLEMQELQNFLND